MEVAVVEIIRAVPGKASELRRELLRLVPIARAANGCLQYDLLEPFHGAGDFLIWMRWETLGHLRQHETSDYVQDFVRKCGNVRYNDVVVTEWKKVT